MNSAIVGGKLAMSPVMVSGSCVVVVVASSDEPVTVATGFHPSEVVGVGGSPIDIVLVSVSVSGARAAPSV